MQMQMLRTLSLAKPLLVEIKESLFAGRKNPPPLCC